MFTVLTQMAILITCGALWQAFAPRHIPATAHRRALTDLVFYILLPALVLNVIWNASLDFSSYKISLLALSGLATGAGAMWVILRFVKASAPQKGALMLAATFPNVTYLGLPVLDKVLGSWSNAIVVQYDLFACTPVLMTLGMLMSHFYGDAERAINPLPQLIKVPPLWAVAFALIFNLGGVPQPEIIHSALSILSGGVVPLMLIALGMSIRWDSLHVRYLPKLAPLLLVTLFIVPAEVFWLTHHLTLSDHIKHVAVLSAAMPAMVFGIVICDRYHLDTALYAAAVTLTTLCCVLTLPLWFHVLSVS